jgi:uncharacterized protein (TIGR03067 family)
MKSLVQSLLTFAFLAIGLVFADDKKDDKLDGKWLIVSVERDGKADDAFKGGARVIAGGKYTLADKNGKATPGTFKVDPSKKPKTIDMMPAEGQYKGKTLLGIYEVDGQTLKICFAEPGKERPTEFASKGAVLAIHKREKP